MDFNALDEYVNFKEANQGLADAIGGIKGAPGTAGDYAAQATRGVLGFAIRIPANRCLPQDRHAADAHLASYAEHQADRTALVISTVALRTTSKAAP